MLQLAKADGHSLTLPELSEREGLSLSYVGKLMMILKKAGLVSAEHTT
jgi:DNA-binding IscR family transcriptional regulator